MKTLTALSFLLISTLFVFSQAPEIEWQNTIGGSGDDGTVSVIQTTDGGYLLGGSSYSGISGDKTEADLGASDYWVVKLDVFGNIEWQNTIGGSQHDWLWSFIQTTDGGYLLGGYSRSPVSGDKTEASYLLGGYDYWVVKLDPSGNIEWQNNIGGNDADLLKSVIQTTDGGYLVAGDSESDNSGDKTEANLGYEDYWVIKLDSSGNIEWQNTIGGSAEDRLESVLQTTEGGYILGGYSYSEISGDKTEVSLEFDYWVVKLDASGNIEWQNTIGGNNTDALLSIIQSTDGGYLLGGYSHSDIGGDKTEASHGLTDHWVVKLGSSGDIEWQNTIGGSGDEGAGSVIQTTDGGYLLGGSSYSGISGDKTEDNLGGSDYWVVKLDISGNIVWQNTIGGSADDGAGRVIQTNDGGYLLGGSSYSGISGDKTEDNLGGSDYWVVKLQGCGLPVNILPDVASICTGSSILLNAANGVEFEWSPSSYLDTTMGSMVTAAPITTISYTVTAIDSIGCTSSDSITITVYALPLPVITIDAGQLCTDIFTAYQWQLDGINIPGATSQCFAIIDPGNYTVIVTDSNDCNAVSEIFNFTSVENHSVVKSFKIYPNPSKNAFTIEFISSEISQQQIHISITNMLGDEVLNKQYEIRDGNLLEQIILHQPCGVYILKIFTKDNQYEKKIIIE